MTVNRDNINLMIEVIRAEKEPILMGTFLTRNTCGTTACLAGWANVLRLDMKGKGSNFLYDDAEGAAKWMGISDEQASRLFYVYHADWLGHEERKTATIKLLELLRDEGDVRSIAWTDVLTPIRNDWYELIRVDLKA